MQHGLVHSGALLPVCPLFKRKSAPTFRSRKCSITHKSGLRLICSSSESSDKPKPPDEKLKGSAEHHKAAADKARKDVQAAAVGKAPVAGKIPAQPAPKAQPAKQPSQAVKQEIPKAVPRPQSSNLKTATWDQAVASDWGPVENKRDFLGTLTSGVFIVGAFLLTTVLFRTISGYRRSHPPKPAPASEAWHVDKKHQKPDSKPEQARFPQRDKAASDPSQTSISQSKAAIEAQAEGKEDQQAASSISAADGQHQEHHEEASMTESDSDSNAVSSSFEHANEHASEHGNEHASQHGSQHATQREQEPSGEDASEATPDWQQGNQSGEEAAAEHEAQQPQDHQQSADESGQPQQQSSAYQNSKRAWKQVQRTGHLAPAPGVAELKTEHNFSDDMSVDALKQRVSAAMRASASAADASRHASGWSSAASQAASKAATSAERASTAATRCQTHLETVVESNTEGLKERIAAAEAAVEEAERSAAEAVHLQNEVVKAASMTEGHSDVASSQSAIAERASRSDIGDGHGAQDIISRSQQWAQEVWQKLAYQSTHLGGYFSSWGKAVHDFYVAVLAWLQHQFANLTHRMSGSGTSS